MIKFRGEMISFLVGKGDRVFCFAPDYDDGARAAVQSLGGTPVDFPLNRSTLSVFDAMASVQHLRGKLRQYGVDLVFCYFLKPIIVANLAARRRLEAKVVELENRMRAHMLDDRAILVEEHKLIVLNQ